MRKWPVFVALCLAACASTDKSYEYYLQNRHVGLSTPQDIRHCHGYGCRIISDVALTTKEWKSITRIFKPAPHNAAAERARIAKAIGLFERIVGPKDGTDKDVAGTFRQSGDLQLDCVDESTNTTTYLSLLQKAGLLRFHMLGGPVMRLPIINAGRWPHQTAVIIEKATGNAYAVDSWFQDNGAPADIIDLPTWKDGWKPQNVHGFL